MKRSSVQFIGEFARAHPGRSVLMVVFLVLAGLAEGIGLITMLPVINSMIAEDAGEGDRLAEMIEAAFGALGIEPTLNVLLLVLVGGITAKAVLVWLGMLQVGYTIARVTLDLRLRLIRSMMKARWSYFVRQPLGGFANAVASEARRASNAYKEACSAAASVIQAFAYFLVAVAISWPVALTGVIAGAGFIFALRGFVRMSRSAGGQMTEMMTSLTDRLTDTVHGIKAMKAMGQEHQYAPILEERTKGLETAQRKQVLAIESMQLLQEPIIAAIIAIGLVLLLTFGEMAFSSILLLIFIFYRLLRFVNSLQTKMQVMVEGESAYWSMMDKINRAELNEEVDTGIVDPPQVNQGIIFRDVSFAYDDVMVLKNASFEVPARSFVAIVGESGSGKTTTGDLIAALLKPTSGKILVDGVPLTTIRTQAWRAMIGYVPQEILLLHDSILNNVTLRDPTITLEKACEALEMAGAWGFVQGLPEGIHEVTGERGGSLSGGQRQRIGLARALVRDPKVLILDEVTAALDPETEQSIAKTLRRLSADVTILSISHRSTMNDLADLVLEVRGGTIKARSRETEVKLPAD